MRRLILGETLHRFVEALMSHHRLTISLLLILQGLLLTEAKLLNPALVSLHSCRKEF